MAGIEALVFIKFAIIFFYWIQTFFLLPKIQSRSLIYSKSYIHTLDGGSGCTLTQIVESGCKQDSVLITGYEYLSIVPACICIGCEEFILLFFCTKFHNLNKGTVRIEVT